MTARVLHDEIMEIEIDRIQPHPQQPRQVYNEEDLDALALDIGRRGLIHPITIADTGDGNFILICGQRRLLATKRIGRTTIRAMVLTPSNPCDFLEVALVENMLRQDLSPLDLAEAFHALIKEKGVHLKDLAELVGKSVPSVCEILNLNRIPHDLRSNGTLRRMSLRFHIKLSKYGTEAAIRNAYLVHEKTGKLPPREKQSSSQKLKGISKRIADLMQQLRTVDYLDLDPDDVAHNEIKNDLAELILTLRSHGWFIPSKFDASNVAAVQALPCGNVG